ncbi:MAG TPA: right-handed parallel beta-helix repeat-containing protein [Planctomycetota bacterium]|nr:right-handed parallel beta-helix repeat-containing protein [Planctomycetota bacterium]
MRLPIHFFLLLTVLAWATFAAGSAADQPEPKNTTLAADREFDDTLTVMGNETLVIQPGVTLKFAEQAGIICNGRIQAQGTAEKPIRFAAKDPAKGWRNVALGGNTKDGSVFEHCQFADGRGRVTWFLPQNLQFAGFPPPGAPAKKELIELNCGGALFLYGPGKVDIHACVFENNHATWAGAVICWGTSKPAIHGCLFRNNRGEEDAGAIQCVAGSDAVIEENYFSGNQAKYGGAIHCLTLSSPMIRNNYITANTASGNSSAISCYNQANPKILGNYIAGNTTTTKSGKAIETVLKSQPEIKGNYIGENKNDTETGKLIGAHAGEEGQPDTSTCDEQEPAQKDAVLKDLQKKGVLELAPAPTKAR